MKYPVLLIALVLVLVITNYAFSHLVARGVVHFGGLGIGAAAIITLLLAAPWLSRHLD